MPLNILICPHCQTTLKPKTPVPEGTRLKCPKCTQPFVAGGEAAPPPKPAATPSRPAVPNPPSGVAPRPAAPKPPPPPPKPPPAEEEDIIDITEAVEDEPIEAVAADAPPATGGGGLAAKFPFLKRFPMWVWLTGAGVTLFLFCGCCGVGGYFTWTWIAGGGVNKANFEKIKKDMSEDQVKGVLGSPTMSLDLGEAKTDIWKSGDDFIMINLVDGRAAEGAYLFTNGSSKSRFMGSLP